MGRGSRAGAWLGEADKIELNRQLVRTDASRSEEHCHLMIVLDDSFVHVQAELEQGTAAFTSINRQRTIREGPFRVTKLVN